MPLADHLLIERDRGQFVPSRRRRMMANVRAGRLLKIPAEPSPELRIPGAAAQTRIVSVVRIRLHFQKSARPFKGTICTDVSEFESSLSGRVGVKRFQTAPSILVLMSLAGILASLRDRHSGPPMMGSEGCGGPISRYVLAVRLTAGIKTRNGLASSIVPAGTSLHRVGGIQFSPIAIVHN